MEKQLSQDQTNMTLLNTVFAVCRIMKIKPARLVKELSKTTELRKFTEECADESLKEVERIFKAVEKKKKK